MCNSDAHRLFNILIKSPCLVFRILPVKFKLKLLFLLNLVDQLHNTRKSYLALY